MIQQTTSPFKSEMIRDIITPMQAQPCWVNLHLNWEYWNQQIAIYWNLVVVLATVHLNTCSL